MSSTDAPAENSNSICNTMMLAHSKMFLAILLWNANSHSACVYYHVLELLTYLFNGKITEETFIERLSASIHFPYCPLKTLTLLKLTLNQLREEMTSLEYFLEWSSKSMQFRVLHPQSFIDVQLHF